MPVRLLSLMHCLTFDLCLGDPLWCHSGGWWEAHPGTQSSAGGREPLLQPHVHMWETLYDVLRHSGAITDMTGEPAVLANQTDVSSCSWKHVILMLVCVQPVWWRPRIMRWSLEEQNQRSSSCWWSLSTRHGETIAVPNAYLTHTFIWVTAL